MVLFDIKSLRCSICCHRQCRILHTNFRRRTQFIVLLRLNWLLCGNGGGSGTWWFWWSQDIHYRSIHTATSMTAPRCRCNAKKWPQSGKWFITSIILYKQFKEPKKKIIRSLQFLIFNLVWQKRLMLNCVPIPV